MTTPKKGLRFRYSVLAALLIAEFPAHAGEAPTIIFAPPADGFVESIPALSGTMLVLLAALLGFMGFRAARSGRSRSGAGMLALGALVTGILGSVLSGNSLFQIAGASAGGAILTPERTELPIEPSVLNTYTNASSRSTQVIDIQLPEESCPNGFREKRCEERDIIADDDFCEIDCRTSPLPSDARLKVDITPVGHAASGLPIYEFRYVGGSAVYRGVLAQEVLLHTPEAVVTLPTGYLGVDYKQLGVEMVRIR